VRRGESPPGGRPICSLGASESARESKNPPRVGWAFILFRTPFLLRGTLRFARRHSLTQGDSGIVIGRERVRRVSPKDPRGFLCPSGLHPFSPVHHLTTAKNMSVVTHRYRRRALVTTVTGAFLGREPYCDRESSAIMRSKELGRIPPMTTRVSGINRGLAVGR